MSESKQLRKAHAKLDYETDRCGPGSGLTQMNQVNSSRLTIWNNNVGHIENIDDPDVPRILTGLENKLASFSSTLIKADKDYKLVHIFKKNEYISYYLMYSKKDKHYRTFIRKPLEEMSENMATRINNEVLDNLNIGDKIKKDTFVSKSNSFDESMNYRPGKQLNTCYMINMDTMEDAFAAMNGAEKMMRSTRCKKYRIVIPDNHILVNVHGDKKNYKPYPNIGETVEDGIILASREKTTLTAAAALNNKALRKIMHKDQVKYGKGRVIDMQIITNKTRDKFVKSQINAKLIEDYDRQMEFYYDVYRYLQTIIDDADEGLCTCHRDLTGLYQEAKDAIDASAYYVKYGENLVGSTIIEFTIMHKVPLYGGSKIVGRFGNKGIIARVYSAAQSWKMADGRPIHIIQDALGVVSRLNPRQHTNLSLNAMGDEVVQQMIETESMSDKFKLLFEFLDFINKEFSKFTKKQIKEASMSQKEVFLAKVIRHGIHVFDPPFNETNILTIEAMEDRYGYNPQRVVFPDGTKSLYPVLCGSQYFLRVKQDPDKKFAARGRGAINPITHLPSRSAEMKHGDDVVSNTAVQFGKFEHEVLAMCKYPEAIALYMAVHSTSTAAPELMSDLYLEKLDLPKMLEIIEAMGASHRKNFEIISAYFLLASIVIEIGYDEDVNWGTDKKAKWVNIGIQ